MASTIITAAGTTTCRCRSAALPGYIAKVKAGENIERPLAQLMDEREPLVADYRELLDTDEDRATYDQLIGLAHRVFPYVEGHKFYCEHWYTNLFFNKIREFGRLLLAHGFFGPDGVEEDVFHLTHYELESAIVDLMLAWGDRQRHRAGRPTGPRWWRSARRRLRNGRRHTDPARAGQCARCDRRSGDRHAVGDHPRKPR